MRYNQKYFIVTHFTRFQFVYKIYAHQVPLGLIFNLQLYACLLTLYYVPLGYNFIKISSRLLKWKVYISLMYVREKSFIGTQTMKTLMNFEYLVHYASHEKL